MGEERGGGAVGEREAVVDAGQEPLGWQAPTRLFRQLARQRLRNRLVQVHTPGRDAIRPGGIDELAHEPDGAVRAQQDEATSPCRSVFQIGSNGAEASCVMATWRGG